jgi:N-methylhydantoinase B
VEALDHRMTAVVWGEGRTYPASSVAGSEVGAATVRLDDKVGRVEILRNDGTVEPVSRNCVLMLEAGERFVTRSAGGGGVGDPYGRDPESVREDVVEGFVSPESARAEYGVVLDAGLALDLDATLALRAGRP